ncbi:chromate transporter [Fusobacterium sp. PH5-44]|uniref:chromate transporter n=1 Tax=unclassified Fusobacterium TaxID=2648384 RepID=UPI003D1CD992
MIYLKLFWSFFQVGLFTIGGGMASLPLIENEVVNYNNWLSVAEFTDLITISQMTPGPIAINSATFVGTRIAGFLGALVATIGFITPSCIIMGILAYILKKYKTLSTVQGILSGLRPAVVAMIAAAGLKILQLTLWGEKSLGNNTKETVGLVDNIKEKFYSMNYVGLCLFLLSLYILRKWKTKPAYTMIGCGILGLVFYY